MTNAESLLQDNVAVLNAGKLSGKAKEFIGQIKNYDKHRLKKLTSAQYYS